VGGAATNRHPSFVPYYIGEMADRCPLCGEDALLDISLSKLGVRICRCCQTTLLPEKSRVALGRILMPITLQLWKSRLEELSFAPGDEKAPQCPDHDEEMERGKVVDFSATCWRARCCDLLLLSPKEMIPFLQELGAGSTFQKRPSSVQVKMAWNPLQFIVRRLVKEEKSVHNDDLGLAEAQYILKLSPALGKHSSMEDT